MLMRAHRGLLNVGMDQFEIKINYVKSCSPAIPIDYRCRTVHHHLHRHHHRHYHRHHPRHRNRRRHRHHHHHHHHHHHLMAIAMGTKINYDLLCLRSRALSMTHVIVQIMLCTQIGL